MTRIPWCLVHANIYTTKYCIFCWLCILLWFLVNDQLDVHFFSMCLFQFSTCFEQPRAHHQEDQLYQYNIWYMQGRIKLFGAPRQWKHFCPLFQTVFLWGGGITPQTESNTTPPSPKTEITNILFHMLNFASIIKFKM